VCGCEYIYELIWEVSIRGIFDNESYCTCLNGQDPQVLHHLMDTSAESNCIYQHLLTASLTTRMFGGG